MAIDRRSDNRRWKSIDDLWKEAFDDNIAALTVTSDPRQADAFGRVRTSSPDTRLDVEFIYDKQSEFFDEITNNGTVTHNAASRDLTLALDDANNGSYAKMASYPVPYTPGNSQLIDMTGVLDLADIGGGTAELFLRSNVTGSVVTTTYPQSDWTDLKTGVDWTTSHILAMDFQSLKVGRIRFALVKNGVARPIYEVYNDNRINTGYWQLANGSCYWDIYTTGGNTYMEMGYGNDNNAIGLRYVITANASATMKAICCTVKSEGGAPLRSLAGLSRSISNGVTPVTASTTLVPIISIRPKATYNSLENLILTIPKGYSISTNNPIRLALIHDGTLTGAAWADVDATSTIEYDVTASAITGGHATKIEYIGATNNTRVAAQGLLGKLALWDRQGAETGIYTVAAVRTGAQDASVLASMDWEEIR